MKINITPDLIKNNLEFVDVGIKKYNMKIYIMSDIMKLT